MTEKVEIKKIVIKIGDREISLGLEEAKKLKNVLDELFAENSKIIYIENDKTYPVPYPYPYPVPVYPTAPYIPYSPVYITWCHTDSNTLAIDCKVMT